MSSDNTAHDTMRRYESNQDAGDTSANATNGTNDPQPASTTPAPGTGNTGNDSPIPMATPQSPVQTEDSPEVKEDSSSEVRSNKGSDRELREV